MTHIPNISSRIAGLAAFAAALAAAVMGVVQITDTPSGESTVVGIEHLLLGALTAELVMLVPVTLFVGRAAGRPRAALAACAGLAALSLLTLVSNVRGEDPSFFAAIAGPSNLLIFGGFIAIGIALGRGDHLPRLYAIGLPLTWVFTFPLSRFGAPLLAGAFLVALGRRLHRGGLPRRAMVAAVAALACLAAPAAAQADSLVFIKDNNVRLSNPNGSGQYQVTEDGTADNPYQSPSQADDGTIVAMRKLPNGGPLYRMKQNGAQLGRIELPPMAVAGPYRPHVSPDGKLVAYEHVYSARTCNQYGCYIETSNGVRYTHADRYTPAEEFGEVGRGSGSPSWIDSGRAMVGLNNVVYTDTLTSDPVEWWFDYDHDFPTGDAIGDGEHAAGRVVVVRGVNDDNTLQFYRSVGNFTDPPTPSCAFQGPAAGPLGKRFADPTFAPHGGAVAWQEGDGIWAADLAPDFEQKCGEVQFRRIIPGASEPDWGPANVNPGPREPDGPPPPCTNCDGPPPPPPPCTSCEDKPPVRTLAVAVPKSVKLAAATKRGIAVKITVPVGGRIAASAKLGKTKLGVGSGKAGGKGTVTVTVRLSKKAAARLRKVKKPALSLGVTFTPADGGAALAHAASIKVKK